MRAHQRQLRSADAAVHGHGQPAVPRRGSAQHGADRAGGGVASHGARHARNRDDALVADALLVEGTVDPVQHVQRQSRDDRNERIVQRAVRARRCAVPVAGTTSGRKTANASCRITSGRETTTARCWRAFDRWRNGDEVVESFAVVTAAVPIGCVRASAPAGDVVARGGTAVDGPYRRPNGAQRRAAALAVAGGVERGAGEHLREHFAQRRERCIEPIGNDRD